MRLEIYKWKKGTHHVVVVPKFVPTMMGKARSMVMAPELTKGTMDAVTAELDWRNTVVIKPLIKQMHSIR